MDAPSSGILDDQVKFVVWAHTSLGHRPIPTRQMERMIQEFSYPKISKAVPRYFNSCTFRSKRLQRRNRLLAAWKCTILILQGYENKTQPREFYENIQGQHVPNAQSVQVRFLPPGHFGLFKAHLRLQRLSRNFSAVESKWREMLPLRSELYYICVEREAASHVLYLHDCEILNNTMRYQRLNATIQFIVEAAPIDSAPAEPQTTVTKWRIYADIHYIFIHDVVEVRYFTSIYPLSETEMF